jgi:hypothetical protein
MNRVHVTTELRTVNATIWCPSKIRSVSSYVSVALIRHSTCAKMLVGSSALKLAAATVSCVRAAFLGKLGSLGCDDAISQFHVLFRRCAL